MVAVIATVSLLSIFGAKRCTHQHPTHQCLLSQRAHLQEVNSLMMFTAPIIIYCSVCRLNNDRAFPSHHVQHTSPSRQYVSTTVYLPTPKRWMQLNVAEAVAQRIRPVGMIAMPMAAVVVVVVVAGSSSRW